MQDLLQIYKTLLKHFGYRNWWPARTNFEVCVGAILTQNTAWRNVRLALANLRRAEALNPEAILNMRNEELAELIRPAGYYNLKASRLKSLVEFLHHQGGRGMRRFAAISDSELRQRLLSVKGVGPETADSILLYALKRPIFVIDAYTIRISQRLGIDEGCDGYQEFQSLFVTHLPLDIDLYNDFHAQLVSLGATYCKPRPICVQCPLEPRCRKFGVES